MCVPDLHFITKLGLDREERVPHMALRLVKMHLTERERGREGEEEEEGGIVRLREREGGREKGQGGERKEKEGGIKRGV